MTDRRFSTPGLTRRLLAPIAALLGLVAGLSVLILPSPAPTTADPTTFSAERAMAAVNRLADEPHSVLRREAHDRARDDVIGMFTDLGYTPTVHSDPLFDLTNPEDKENFQTLPAELQTEVKDAPAESIVVDVPGKSERTMALMAHYDSSTVEEDEDGVVRKVPGNSYGASDDGYGVAAIVETLRAIKAEGRQPENSLKIVITDGEEVGLVGARNEMRHHRADYKNVDLVLNLEARGTSGPALMFETSSNNSAVAGYFLSHVKQPVTGSLLPSLYARMPNTTDMAAFIPEGFTVLNIAAIGDAEHYHHPTDAPRYVDHSTLQHYGDQVLDLTRAWAFDGQAPTLTADGDLHFFPLWRGLTVRYPAAVRTFTDSWERFTPFLAFPPMVRRVIYTTNAIESLNYQLRKVTRNRGHFPSDEAAVKLLWLAICNIEDKRARQRQKEQQKGRAGKSATTGRLIEGAITTNWKQALQQLSLAYPDRINPHL